MSELPVPEVDEDDELLKSLEVTMKITEQKNISTTTTITTSSPNTTPKEEKKKGIWNKLTQKVKSTLFSSEVENALDETMELLQILLKDLEFRPIDITVTLAWMSVYHQAIALKTNNHISKYEDVKTLLHYMKFASAAYGWKLIYGYAFKNKTQGLIDGIKMNDAANVKALIDHTGIKEQDIIETRWTSANIFAPGHYVAIDHATKSIIIAIRGTFHLRDAITDLSARYVPFHGGHAHSGILNAAKAKQIEMIPVLEPLSRKHPGYQLVIVGHSLGAGTASLLSFLLREEQKLDVKCYAFAPPCVMSLDLATQCKDYITSVVLNDDIVPRLSFGSVTDMKLTLQDLLNQKDGKVQRLFHIMTAGNQFGENATKKMASYLKCNATPDALPQRKTMSDRLYPPGFIYYLYSAKRGLKNYDICEESHPSLFCDIIMSYSMYTDHLPDCYEKALTRAIERLEKNAIVVTTTVHETTVTKEVVVAIEDKEVKDVKVVTVVEEKDIVKKQKEIGGSIVEEDETITKQQRKVEVSSVAEPKVVKVPPKLPPKKKLLV